MPVEPSVLMDLHAETPEGEVKQRKAVMRGGRPIMKNGAPLMLDYVTARYVQQRLDDVVGPENWQATFKALDGGAVECTLSIHVWVPVAAGDTKTQHSLWISKADVGIPSMIEPQKGAYSDAFKRAGVHWGIARDLYEERDETEIAAAPPVPTRSIRSRMEEGDEDFDESPPPPRPARRASTGNGGYRQQVQRAAPRASDDALMLRFQQDEADGEVPWLCPVHAEVQLMPGGTSKAGKPYGPWLTCTDRQCDERGPFLSDLYRDPR